MKDTSSLAPILNDCEAVIFDFDGLLADSEPYHYRAYNEVFERYGHTLDPDEYWVEWTSKGKGIQGEIERHQLDLDVDPKALRLEKFKLYSVYCQSGDIKLFPSAKQLVRLLGEKRKLAIASGSWKHDIEAILDNADARTLFPVILGKGEALREKPHPDIFLEAARALDCPPQKCIVIEDALKGLTAAKGAQMPCVIIRNPLNQEIHFPEADAILPNLDALLNHLEAEKRG
ncbi:MAG: HAD family phosphatase [Candidatus Nitrohelix vancouverensis]|uniref:HAD family phosphatase n=1 Tax=Candidatus Nitrohelix vancouverensis TaxID=2705534 RepID=A0A7T0C014_9BACT|nr:MAG: HAD family phosphatase [Candidatus Nitrohelix vancouverensis]